MPRFCGRYAPHAHTKLGSETGLRLFNRKPRSGFGYPVIRLLKNNRNRITGSVIFGRILRPLSHTPYSASVSVWKLLYGSIPAQSAVGITASQIAAAQQAKDNGSCAEPVELLDGNSGSADGGILGGIDIDEWPPGPSDADVHVVGGTHPGDPASAAVKDGFVKSHFVLGTRSMFLSPSWLPLHRFFRGSCPACSPGSCTPMTHAELHNDRYCFVANPHVMCVARHAMRVPGNTAKWRCAVVPTDAHSNMTCFAPWGCQRGAS